jgi:hypothetical protein
MGDRARALQILCGWLTLRDAEQVVYGRADHPWSSDVARGEWFLDPDAGVPWGPAYERVARDVGARIREEVARLEREVVSYDPDSLRVTMPTHDEVHVEVRTRGYIDTVRVTERDRGEMTCKRASLRNSYQYSDNLIRIVIIDR